MNNRNILNIKGLIVLLAALLLTVLCGCSGGINSNSAEKIMRNHLNPIWGSGNYTLYGFQTFQTGMHSNLRSDDAARALVKLNDGRSFECQVRPDSNGNLEYCDKSNTLFFNADFFRAKIESASENTNGVTLEDLEVSDIYFMDTFYDETQFDQFYAQIVSEGRADSWKVEMTYKVDSSLPADEASSQMMRVIDQCDACGIPNPEYHIQYGECLYELGDLETIRPLGETYNVPHRNVYKEDLPKLFAIEEKHEADIKAILDERYAEEGYTITEKREIRNGIYHYYLDVNGRTIWLYYDGETYVDNYVEIFRSDEIWNDIIRPLDGVDDIETGERYNYRIYYTEKKYDGDLSEFYRDKKNYFLGIEVDFTPGTKTSEEMARVVCDMDEYYREHGMNICIYIVYGDARLDYYEGNAPSGGYSKEEKIYGHPDYDDLVSRFDEITSQM